MYEGPLPALRGTARARIGLPSVEPYRDRTDPLADDRPHRRPSATAYPVPARRTRHPALGPTVSAENGKPEPSLRHSIAGMSRWARVDPEERVAHARRMAAKSVAVRTAAREARIASGEIPASRKQRKAPALPPLEELEEHMRAIQAERDRDGLEPLDFASITREASLRQRLAIARATQSALKYLSNPDA